MYGGRVVLLESNKEGLVVLILAGLSIVLVNSDINNEMAACLQ